MMIVQGDRNSLEIFLFQRLTSHSYGIGWAFSVSENDRLDKEFYGAVNVEKLFTVLPNNIILNKVDSRIIAHYFYLQQ